jgi:hypothetical protein
MYGNIFAALAADSKVACQWTLEVLWCRCAYVIRNARVLLGEGRGFFARDRRAEMTHRNVRLQHARVV